MSVSETTKSWPYVEARKIRDRNPQGVVTFQTGFGPSGSAHIGTFSEVARTTMVRRAYEDLMGWQKNQNTRLVVFSDDMDALRSVPDNVPNCDEMEKWIGYSLTRVPDPFGTHESFAHHNNAMLREFLDRFELDYDFLSATTCYSSGQFNDSLEKMWHGYDKVLDIILPTLGDDRRRTYSPFMPIMRDGRVLNSGVTLDQSDELGGFIMVDCPEAGLHIMLDDEATGNQFELPGFSMPIYNGEVKCQWKADWALRWLALGVDYEMAGKDLTDSVKLSSQIVRALGGTPPVNMIYELFLDDEGHKISKSKGNGLTINEWLSYGSLDSLRHYLYQTPTKAKALSRRVVARTNDELIQARSRYVTQPPEQQISNSVHFLDTKEVDLHGMTFSLLLNLASTIAPDVPEDLWAYVIGEAGSDGDDSLRELVCHAFEYYRDELAGTLTPREPNDEERIALQALLAVMCTMPDSSTAEEIQFEAYEIGKMYYGETRLREWFALIYEVLLGQSSGPRFGAYARLYGVSSTCERLRERITAVATT